MAAQSVSPTTTIAPGTEAAGRPVLRNRLTMALRYAINIVLLFIFVFPIVFMIMSSFKSKDAIFADMRSFRAFLPVGDLSWDNYTAVFTQSKFLVFLANSIGISIVTIALGLLVNSLAAYALSRLQWRGQRLVLTLIIATLIIPGEVIMIPLLLLVSRLPNLSFDQGMAITQGWLNTYQVLIIPFITSADAIFLFYQFFQDIPRELDEAALVDGANRWQIYRHVILPNSQPVFATVAILTFQGSWNMFLWPIMTIQSENLRPVMVGMQYFFQQNTQWGAVMAYATLVTLPVLLLFLAFQGAFVKSIATTGLKG
jgi:multiple sugar transport system permease protein